MKYHTLFSLKNSLKKRVSYATMGSAVMSTFTTLKANKADDKLVDFFLFFPENMI